MCEVTLVAGVRFAGKKKKKMDHGHAGSLFYI